MVIMLAFNMNISLHWWLNEKVFNNFFLTVRYIYTSTCHQIYSKSFILLNVFINSSVALKLRFTFNLWIFSFPSLQNHSTIFLCVKIGTTRTEILLRWTLHFNQIDNIMKSSSSIHIYFNATSWLKWCTVGAKRINYFNIYIHTRDRDRKTNIHITHTIYILY